MPPETKQTPTDQKIFDENWHLKEGWTLEIAPLTTESGWEYKFVNKRDNEEHFDIDLAKARLLHGEKVPKQSEKAQKVQEQGEENQEQGTPDTK